MTEQGDTPGSSTGRPPEAGPAGPPPSRETAEVERLRADVRQRVAQRRAASSAGPGAERGGGCGAGPPIDWATIVASLHQAEQYANIGRRLPELPARFNRPFRVLARCVARVVLYFSRYLLSEQREFNNATLGCLRSLQRGLYQMEQGARHLGQELARLGKLPAVALPPAEPKLRNGDGPPHDTVVEWKR